MNKFKKGSLAISQITILVVALFAFAFLVGGLNVVSAGETNCGLHGGNCIDNKENCEGTVVVEGSWGAKAGELCPGTTNIYCCVPENVNPRAYYQSEDERKSTETSSHYIRYKEGGKIKEIPVTEEQAKDESSLKKIIGGVATTVTTFELIEKTGETTKKLKSWIRKPDGSIINNKLLTGDSGLYAGTEGTLGPSSTKIPTKDPGFLAKSFKGSFNSGWANALNGLVWATVLFAAGRYIGEAAGLNVANAQRLGYALAGGYAGGYYGAMAVKAIWGASIGLGPAGWIGAGAGAVFYFLALHKNAAQEIISLQCNTWQAPLKGENCEKCNDYELGCTEYQCKSLGQGCEFFNENGEAMCIDTCERKINPPIISAWGDALLSSDFKYTPDNAINPPNRGVKVEYKGGCAKAFTPISFGIESDEPARCKISPISFPTFEDMPDIYMDGVGLKYNHEFALSLPSNESLAYENITLENGGQYELYVKCGDACGNSLEADFIFKYCVDEGPDTTPPVIVYTNPLDGEPISFNQTSMEVDVYVNEPAMCRWDREDKSYDDMSSSTESSSEGVQTISNMLYTVPMTLTGLKDRIDNKFYIRCKDRTSVYTNGERVDNENGESYELNLKGTEPLIITDIEPNETIKDSTDVVNVKLKAKTSGGYDSGKAICGFSETGDAGSYTEFFYGYDTELFSQYEHEEGIDLENGTYNYYIQCCDRGNNCDTKQTSFTIEIDRTAPLVVRAFHDNNYLKIITNEESQCYYDTKGNNYAIIDGTEMTALSGGLQHFTKWDSKKTFYIKCVDVYGNPPKLQTDTSIVVKPFEA